MALVGEETEPPSLSKEYLVGDRPREDAFRHDAQWWAAHDLELMLGRRAITLDLGARAVTLDGVDQLRYDKLLLATGL